MTIDTAVLLLFSAVVLWRYIRLKEEHVELGKNFHAIASRAHRGHPLVIHSPAGSGVRFIRVRIDGEDHLFSENCVKKARSRGLSLLLNAHHQHHDR